MWSVIFLSNDLASVDPQRNDGLLIMLIEDNRDTANRVSQKSFSGLIPGLRLANERRRYFVTTSLIGWAQT